MPFFEAPGTSSAWRVSGACAASSTGSSVLREEAAALELAVAHADAAGDGRYATESRISLGSCICWGPMPVDAAIARTRQMLEEARGVRWVEAPILGMLGYLLAMADDLSWRVRTQCAQPCDLRGARDDVQAAARAVIPESSDGGNLDAAEQRARAGHDQLEASGENERRLTIAARSPHVLYEQDRDDEAEAFARACEQAAAADDVGLRCSGARAREGASAP